MKKTKIDWCDSTINCVYGCPNGCKYCYGNVMNKRFHFCKNWNIPEWKPEHLKEFYSKKPKSIFIDSMSDIGTWKEEWFNAVAKAISDNPQHRYIALTKRFDRLMDMFLRFPPPIEIFIGISVTTQANANAATLVHRFHNTMPDFYSIEPILQSITIPDDAIPKTLIIGAETGNRKGKVVPQKEWIDRLVRQADEHNSIVFMKESLRSLMGNDFRQDEMLWRV